MIEDFQRVRVQRHLDLGQDMIQSRHDYLWVFRGPGHIPNPQPAQVRVIRERSEGPFPKQPDGKVRGPHARDGICCYVGFHAVQSFTQDFLTNR